MSNYQGNIIIKNPATPTGPFETGSAPGVWTLSEAMAFKRQGIWPTQGIQDRDAYFNYVSLLLSTTALGNANNSLFVDSSGAFNPISRTGNTTQGSFTPYSANWSNYFDGTSDWLATPNNAAFSFGTGDYTIECWIYPTSTKSDMRLWQFSGDSDNVDISSGGSTGAISYYNGSTSAVSSSGVITFHAWNHIACVRSSGTVRLYVNGVLRVTQATTPNSSSRILYIAGQPNSWFQGYISNFRVVKGTAVYTSAFTPPTSALTAISGTSLLTCQSNRFRDASANNFTVTPSGDVRVTDFAPLSSSTAITYNQSDITNWSGYFDGSGDYLTAPSNAAFAFGTGDFTVEFWINVPNFANFRQHISTRTSETQSYWSIDSKADGVFYFYTDTFVVSTAPQRANTWIHIAAVRSSGTLTLYVNGVSQGSASATNNFLQSSLGIGAGPNGVQPMTGYLSNVRLVKGTAVYTSNFTPPSANLTAISGTSILTLQNAAFTDNSTNNFVITINGNTTVTGNSPFNPVGYWSNYFDGTGDYLNLSNKITFGTGNFTVEGWVYRTASTTIYDGVFSLEGTGGDWNSGAAGLAIGCGNFHIAGVGSVNYSSSVPLNEWTHIACSRSGSLVKVFLNGSEVASTNSTASLGGTAGNFPIVGAFDTLSGLRFPLSGYISNLRVVSGTALYTGTFTPPTSPLTAISGTSLLTCQNGRFIDNSTNNFSITRNGDVSVQSFDPFYAATIASNGGSMYFDNTDDYLVIPANPSLALGTSNFTLEAWVYGIGSWATDPIFECRSSGSSANGYAFLVNSSGNLNVYTAGNFVGNSATALNLGSWNHVALVRSGTGGNQTTYYINGVASGSITLSGNFTDAISNETKIGGSTTAGEIWNGYISNARITKSALYTTNFTPPTFPLTASANTVLLVNGMNAGIYDATGINNIETLGDSKVTTAVSKFDGSSVYFDGTTDYMVISGNKADWTWVHNGQQNWTIEFWAYNLNTDSMGVFCTNTNSINTAYGAVMGLNLMNGAGSIGGHFTRGVDGARMDWYTAGGILSANQWNHVVLQFNTTTKNMEVYLNGVSRTVTNQNVVNNSPTGGDGSAFAYSNEPPSFNPNLGRVVGGATVGLYFNGYIDEMRITRGIRRYTANFTPPTKAFPAY